MGTSIETKTLMKTIIGILILLSSLVSHAVVLTEPEIQSLQEQVQKQNPQYKVQLLAIEYRAVFEDGEFRYFEMATESNVEVSEASNRMIIFPKVSAKKSAEVVLNSLCQILGDQKASVGQRTSHHEHKISEERISDKSDFGQNFMGQVQYVKYRSWSYKMDSECRCYDKNIN